MPPLGTRKYEKGHLGNGPLGELKDELVTNLNRLVVRAWELQYPDRPESDNFNDLQKVDSPKTYSYKTAGGILVSAWAHGQVTSKGRMLSGEIITQDVMHEGEGFAEKGSEEERIFVNGISELVFIREDQTKGSSGLTYQGEMDMIQDALETVEEIGKLIKPADKN